MTLHLDGAPSKPTALTPLFTKIPINLTARDQWVLWRYEFKDVKWTKVPYRADGQPAKTTDPCTWTSFEIARDKYIAGGFDGIGFVTSASDPFVLIDIDNVRDLAANGALEPWARAIVKTAWLESAFVEVSPSGTGIHIIGVGPQGQKGQRRNRVEMYCHGRFFTITGRGYKKPPTDPLGEIPKTIQLVAERLAQKATLGAPSTSGIAPHPEDAVQHNEADQAELTDDDVIEIARKAKNRRKFIALFDDGKWKTGGCKYASRSEADLALAGMLAFYSGGNRAQIERLMRKSAMFRPKWDQHSTYLTDTIAKALAGRTEFYRSHTTQTQAADEAWTNTLRREGSRVIGDEENVRLAFAHDPALQDLVRFNEFSGELVLMRPVPTDGKGVANSDTPRRWRDADSVAVTAYLQRKAMPRLSRDKVDAVLGYYARHHGSFHPVRDYLRSLKWDGVSRVGEWLTRYMGAAKPHEGEPQPHAYLSEVGQCFLVSAVARIFQPGCQADCALVLEGPQGIFKSTAARTLAGPEWFSDTLPSDLHHKDAKDHVRGKWMIELPELAQFKRNEIETVKAFLSRRTEMFRPSYGRHEITYPRQCVFIGTTNSSEYLMDTTGNRRFWCVKCGKIDIDGLREARDQLWAEAVELYRNGAQWHLTGEVLELATREAAQRVTEDPWKCMVAEKLEYLSLAAQKGISPGEVLQTLEIKPEQRHAQSAARIGRILSELGWRRGTHHRTRGRLFHPPKAGVKPVKPVTLFPKSSTG